MSDEIASAEGFAPSENPPTEPVIPFSASPTQAAPLPPAPTAAIPIAMAIPVDWSAATIHDLEVPRFWLSIDRIVIGVALIVPMIGIMTAAIVLASAARRTPGAPPSSAGLIVVGAFLAVFATVGLVGLIQHLRMKRLARRLADEANPTALRTTLIEARRRRPLMTQRRLFKQLAIELARREKFGATMRVHFPNGGESIRPIMDPFEPRVLNETDSAFQDLFAATQVEDIGNGQAASAIDGAADKQLGRGVRRNIALKGGIWPRIFLFLLLIKETVYSVQAGRPTFRFYLFAGFMLLFFFLSPTGGALLGWHLVPGAVYLRILNGKIYKRQYRLLRRTASVLLVMQMTRDSYWAYVTDGTDARESRFTRREVQLLLRGWTSPAETPDEARIAQMI